MTIFRTPRIHAAGFFSVLSGLLLSFTTPNASAGILVMKPGEKSIEGVKLAKEVLIQFEGSPLILKPYASGIRKKKIALFWAKGYVGQIFAPEGLNVPPKTMEEAFSTLAKQPVVALTMTFLRDVPVSRQKASFKDSLQANGVDPDSDPVKPLFSFIEKGGDAMDTMTTTIVFERRKDGSEWIQYENGKGEFQSRKVDKGVIEKILSIWVGKPADSGMERLQEQFLGKED